MSKTTITVTLQRRTGTGPYQTVHRYTELNVAVRAKALPIVELRKIAANQCSLWQNADPNDTNRHYRVFEQRD